jgi:hypothetical protein
VIADRLVLVQALKAFNNHGVGEIYVVPMTQATAHLIVVNYLRLLDDPAWRRSDLTEQRSE